MTDNAHITNTILLDMIEQQREVGERLASIETSLQHGAQRHDEMAHKLNLLTEQVKPLQSMEDTISRMEPVVNDYKEARSRMAGVFMACSVIAGGIGFFASAIKDWVLKHLGS